MTEHHTTPETTTAETTTAETTTAETTTAETTTAETTTAETTTAETTTAGTFSSSSAREEPARGSMTLESMWAAQMREQLARFGLEGDVSVAALVAVAQGEAPPWLAVDGPVRLALAAKDAEIRSLRAAVADDGAAWRKQFERAEAAEAEVARLRETVKRLSVERNIAVNTAASTTLVQERVAAMKPSSLGVRVALENTLQNARTRDGEQVVGCWNPAECSAAGACDGEQGGEREVGGVAAIADERWRQIDEEGYTAEHDERHAVRQFVATALAYLGAPNRAAWPIKRANPESGMFQRRDLVKAGALVAAAIDRLDAEHGEQGGER